MSDTNGRHHPPDLATAVALLAEVTAQTDRATAAHGGGAEEWDIPKQTTVHIAELAATEDSGASDEPLLSEKAVGDDGDAVDVEWYLRPWRERVQAADVAIAGLVVVIALVVGLVFWLASPSTAPGSKPLAFPQLSVPSHTGTGTTHNPATGSSSTGSPASSTNRGTGSGSGPASSQSSGVGTQSPGPVAPNPSRTSSSPAGHAAAAATPQCTPGDLTVSTSTDSSNYSVGSSVTVTTDIVANTACVFEPVASGSYGCPTTVVIVNQVGAPVYPQPGQGEQCAAVTGGTLDKGYGRSVTIVWDQAPPGEYSAVGTWSFGNSANPYQVSASSQPFTVSL